MWFEDRFIDISKDLPKNVCMSQWCGSDVRNVVVYHLYRCHFAFTRHEVKRLGLYVCTLHSLPFQVVLGQLSVWRLIGLSGHCLYPLSAIFGFLRTHGIRQPVDFSMPVISLSYEGLTFV